MNHTHTLGFLPLGLRFCVVSVPRMWGIQTNLETALATWLNSPGKICTFPTLPWNALNSGFPWKA